MADLKPLRELRNIIAGTLIGIFWPSWFILFYFGNKWKMTGPKIPEGKFIYAHLEHGGLTYYTALQSAASKLVFPIFLLALIGIILAPKRNIHTQKLPIGGQVTWDRNDPYHLCYIAMGISAILTIIAIFFYGHTIIQFFISMGLRP